MPLRVKRLSEGLELDKALSPNFGNACRDIASGGARARRCHGRSKTGLGLMALAPVRTWIFGV